MENCHLEDMVGSGRGADMKNTTFSSHFLISDIFYEKMWSKGVEAD